MLIYEPPDDLYRDEEHQGPQLGRLPGLVLRKKIFKISKTYFFIRKPVWRWRPHVEAVQEAICLPGDGGEEAPKVGLVLARCHPENYFIVLFCGSAMDEVIIDLSSSMSLLKGR